jgi:MFS family permease
MKPSGPYRPWRNPVLLLLGLVSLFSEIASQMVYPLMPQFLEGLGASKSLIGLIEGAAASAAELLRTLFGRWSDRLGRRKGFVLAGYGLAALARPLLFLATQWQQVLGLRFADRVGKALRSPARDALLSVSVPPAHKGASFGFQRALDRSGAILGPLAAMAVLHYFPGELRQVFLWSALPALLAVGLLLFVKDQPFTPAPRAEKAAPAWSSRSFRVLLLSQALFSLGASSDAFLLLKAGETGISAAWLPLLWMLYNLSCVIWSPIFGSLSDRWGRRRVILLSFGVYAFLYFCFGLASESWQMWPLFFAYGVYYGLSAGVLRAYVAELAPPERRGSAYGLLNTVTGLAVLLASLLTGFIWDLAGSQAALWASAAFAVAGAAVMLAGDRRLKT